LLAYKRVPASFLNKLKSKKEQSNLEILKNCQTLGGLANLLDFKPKSLSFILHILTDKRKYFSFHIQKKNGGVREINAPSAGLKKAQHNLANILYLCWEEINIKNNLKPLAHGYQKGLSIYSNALLHKNKRYVLNFDLKDFFPSINFGRVRGYFLKNRDFKLNEKIATYIAQIASFKNELPQGSPCSPIISNLIAHILDVRLVQLAKKYSCQYSRYVDDITFSTNQQIFPQKIAFYEKNNFNNCRLGSEVKEQIKRSGFFINPRKTRMTFHNDRQLVTGLVVNKKVNIRREYYLRARSMVHSLFQSGYYKIPSFLSPVDIEDSEDICETETELQRLEGILNHIYFIKMKSLEIHHNFNLNTKEGKNRLQKEKENSAVWKLVYKFNFFKFFGRGIIPVILCEGPTDVIYLKLALKKLYELYPHLIKFEENKFHYKIKITYITGYPKHDDSKGGTGELQRFINDYRTIPLRINQWSYGKLIIILVDNDEAGEFVNNTARKKFEDTYKPNDKFGSLYYNIYKKLCLLKLPAIDGLENVDIEDLFDDKYKFKGWQDRKMDLAKTIISNFNDVNFDMFKPLLNKIQFIVEDKNHIPPV